MEMTSASDSECIKLRHKSLVTWHALQSQLELHEILRASFPHTNLHGVNLLGESACDFSDIGLVEVVLRFVTQLSDCADCPDRIAGAALSKTYKPLSLRLTCPD